MILQEWLAIPDSSHEKIAKRINARCGTNIDADIVKLAIKGARKRGWLDLKLPANFPITDPFGPMNAGTTPELPIPAAALAQLGNYRKLEELAAKGDFHEFRGEYVAVLDGKLVGHGVDGEAVLKKVAEEYGEAAGLAAVRYLD
jgi:hypothetical protein